MTAVVSRPDGDRWCDAEGTPLTLFCRVEQVEEVPEPGLLTCRVGQQGEVVGRGLETPRVLRLVPDTAPEQC